MANFILSVEPDLQPGLVSRIGQNYTDSVIDLLMELDRKLVERVWVIPKIKKLRTDIGYKKKLGVTHFTKLLKQSARRVEFIEDFYVIFDFTDTGRFIMFLGRHYAGEDYSWPRPKKVEKLAKKYYALLPESQKDASVRTLHTKTLTIQSELVKELFTSPDALLFPYFQKEVLASLLELPGRLEQAHKKQRSSLKSLLQKK